MKNKILELRALGKTYLQIQQELGCSKGTIAYHCGEGQSEKSRERCKRNREKDGKVLITKIDRLTNLRRKVHDSMKSSQRKHDGISKYSKEGKKEFIERCLTNPVCFWTGRKIDLNDSRSYELDHYIPLSKGGSNLFSNIVLSSREANRMKDSLLPETFIALAKAVLENQGYTVSVA